MKNRQRGSLLGLAVGDALGAAVEFKSPGTFPEVTGYRGGGPHGLNPGEWTDDTSMALALADSIASVGWDLSDQACRYVAWWQNGEYSVTGDCFDIGITTRSSLSRFHNIGDARISDSPSEHASGNGSIMRLAPVPIRYAELFPNRLDELIEKLVDSSLTTHASPLCLSSCAYMGLVLCGLIHGLSRDEVLRPNWTPLLYLKMFYPLHPKVEKVTAGSFRNKQPPEIEGSSFVVKSLEAALWAFHNAQDFRQAVLRAVNLGDDANTTGAICGQFAGAYWGESGIPLEWRQGLAGQDMIEKAIEGLLGKRKMSNKEYHLARIDSAPPSISGYWVVPDLLFAGPYPDDYDPVEHQTKIQTILNAGIRTFINLMHIDEINHDGHPFRPYDELIKQFCPTAIFVRIPIVDLSVPSVEEMTNILNTIDRSLEEKKPVYVHCWGGVGRTGTVVGCWLLRHGLATPENYLDVLFNLRRQDRDRGQRMSPETGEQQRFVREWLSRSQFPAG